MAYTKTTWTDRVLQYAKRYKLKDISTGSVVSTYDLEQVTGTVTASGTPLNATNLNKMEQGIADAHTLIDAKLSKTVTIASGVDLNTIIESGFYYVNSTVNTPEGYTKGQLIVSRGGTSITQIYAHYSNGDIYTRSGNPSTVGGNGAWTTWIKLITQDDADLFDNMLPLTGGTITGNLVVNGTITGSKVYGAVYNDYAELFEKDDYSKTYEFGHIIALNEETGKYKYATKDDSSLVVGVVSNNYGTLLGGDKGKSEEENLQKYIPIGLAGRLPIYIIGKIKAGDLITISDIEGVGIKSEDKVMGTIIGKALESKNYDEMGLINMLILNM